MEGGNKCDTNFMPHFWQTHCPSVHTKVTLCSGILTDCYADMSCKTELEKCEHFTWVTHFNRTLEDIFERMSALNESLRDVEENLQSTIRREYSSLNKTLLLLVNETNSRIEQEITENLTKIENKMSKIPELHEEAGRLRTRFDIFENDTTIKLSSLDDSITTKINAVEKIVEVKITGTQKNLSEIEESLKNNVVNLEQGIAAVEVEFSQKLEKLQNAFTETFDTMEKEIETIKQKNSEISDQVRRNRDDVDKEIQQVRKEMEDLHAEEKDEVARVRVGLADLRRNMENKVGSLHQQLDIVSEDLTGIIN